MIFMEIIMPERHGLEATRVIRERQTNARELCEQVVRDFARIRSFLAQYENGPAGLAAKV